MYGLPFIRPILEVSRMIYPSAYLGYVNSDILFTSNLFALLDYATKSYPPLFPIVQLLSWLLKYSMRLPLLSEM